ncbi:MAG: efflux RND transporter periplasmic adaptor subunit [Desulfovermiculus sp.]
MKSCTRYISFRMFLMWVCFICLGCNGQPEADSASSTASQPRPVVTMTVPEANGPRQVSYPGRVQAAVQTRLSFEQAGTIEDMRVHKGSRVQAGQVLAGLDPGDYRLAVKDRQAGLHQVQARLEEARSSYKRVKALYETRNLSRKDLDKARGTLKALEAREDAARNALHQAKKDIEDCLLRAPWAGKVADVPLEAHQTVQAGQPAVILNSEQDMEVEITVPEAVISGIEAGDMAQIHLDALPQAELAARVSEVGAQAGALGTYPVVLVLEQGDSRIRAGMAAQANLRTKEGRQAVCVPVQAVVGESGGSRFVWKVDREHSTVGKHKVVVGDLTAQGVQILSGLKGGETIVLRGVHRLREGMHVRVLDHESGRSVPEE